MAKKTIWTLVILAAAALGVWWWTAGGDGAAADVTTTPGAAVPEAAAAPLAVDLYRVEPRPLEEEVWTTGELRADERVELAAEVAGRVAKIYFDEGARVRAGDLLVKIDDAELRAQLRRTEVELELARTRERRARTLLDEETISQELYDEASSGLGVLDADIELTRARIDRTEIRAPFGGVVGLRRISEGAYVAPATRVATLQNLDPIKIDLSVPEKYAGRVSSGQDIEFTVAGSDTVHHGTIYAVEPAVDVETRTLELRARCPNPKLSLLPGAFAKVRLVLGTKAAALLVPSIALVPELGRSTVFVEENGVAQQREVEIGLRTDDMVEIIRGLDAGDRVLISGLQQIQPGAPVVAR